MLKDTVGEVRSISKNISPPNIAYFGPIESIKTLILNFSYQTGIKAECIVFEIKDKDLASSALFVYRIIQEAINNISKHAKATSVQVQVVNIGYDKVRIMIEDNGIGFDYDSIKKDSKGFGINNIEHRVKALKGTCTIDSLPKHGTTICIDFPKF
jgi:two-component system sensor histidine kinase DegS